MAFESLFSCDCNNPNDYSDYLHHIICRELLIKNKNKLKSNILAKAKALHIFF